MHAQVCNHWMALYPGSTHEQLPATDIDREGYSFDTNKLANPG